MSPVPLAVGLVAVAAALAVSSDEEVVYLSDAGASGDEGAPLSRKAAAWKNKSGKWWKEPRKVRYALPFACPFCQLEEEGRVGG